MIIILTNPPTTIADGLTTIQNPKEAPGYIYNKLRLGIIQTYKYRATQQNNPIKDKELIETIIATDPLIATTYAFNILRGPFPIGEPAIARDPRLAAVYAIHVLKGPFSLGEKTIASNPIALASYQKFISQDQQCSSS